MTRAVTATLMLDAEEALDEIVKRPGGSGELLMPPDDHGFSRELAWLNDRCGVPRQLNLQ